MNASRERADAFKAAFTRDLARQMEADLGTRLDWVAVDHWNTDNPHIHILGRGKADDGRDLVIDKDYIREGMRGRAEERVSLELGPRSEREINQALAREVEADRWTSLDRRLRVIGDELGGVIDARCGAPPDEPRGRPAGRVRGCRGAGWRSASGASGCSSSA